MKLVGIACALLLALSLPSFTKGNKNHTDNGNFKQLLAQEAGNVLFDKYRTALLKQNWSALESVLLDKFLNISTECLADLDAVKNNTGKLVKYIDAAGKPRSGISRGNLFWMGSFSTCQDISDSQYCFSNLALYTSYNFIVPGITWGACFPKSCNTTDISQLLGFLFGEVDKALHQHVNIKYSGSTCSEKPTYSTGVKVTLALCGFLLLLCLIGTLIDWGMEIYDESIAAKKPPVSTVPNGTEESSGFISSNGINSANFISEDHVVLLPSQTGFRQRLLRQFLKMLEPLRGFFLCFSLVRNAKKIFNTDVPATAITSINGVRVISMAWVILGHTFFMFILNGFTENKRGLLEDSQLFTMMAVINAEYSVDSFFFLSGLLVAYTCFRKIKKSGGCSKFNWGMFYFHRFWRLTPAYMFVILFSVYLQRFLSNGPAWYSQYENKACTEYWWTNLLYINNFYPKKFMGECIAWTWYLANDMQFFVITPPLLIIVYRFGWLGLLAPAGVLQACTIVTGVIYGYYDLDPMGHLKFTHPQTPDFQKKQNEYQNYVYSKPYCRIQPYLVGFMLGYFIYRNYSHSKRPGWIVTLLGWGAAAAAGLGLLYGPHDSAKTGSEEWNLASRVVFGALERLLWSLVLAWVTYACHYRAGGLVQKFLSAKFWIPLSRLSYSVYLVHLIVLTVIFVGAQGTIHYDFFSVTCYFIAAVVLSYAAAFILAVAIEFPCDNIENMVVKFIRSSQRSNGV